MLLIFFRASTHDLKDRLTLEIKVKVQNDSSHICEYDTFNYVFDGFKINAACYVCFNYLINH